jgi:hypothetical protein
MSAEVPARWSEPIEEGLWRPSLLFGIPFWFNLYHPTFWFVGFLAHSFWFSVQLSCCIHALLMAATAVEPEWLQIANDVLNEPGEIEP